MKDQACSNCSSRLKCRNPNVIPIEPINWWYITDHGHVLVDGIIREVSEYCIDVVYGSKHKLLFCPQDANQKIPTLIKVFMFLSCLSILVIIILHVIIKDLRVIYFTKLKIPFLVSLFFAYMPFLYQFLTQTAC